MRKILLGLLFSFSTIFLIWPTAYAQQQSNNQEASPEQVGGTFFENLEVVATRLKDQANGTLTGAIFKAGLTFSEKVIAPSLAVAGGLALIYLLVESISVMSGRNTPMALILADIALPVGLCAYLLQNYQNLIVLFAGQGGFLDFIRMLGGDVTLTVMDMYSAVLSMVGTTIKQSWMNISIAFKTDWTAIGVILFAIADLLACLIFSIVIIILCMSGLAEIIGLVLLGPFLGAVAVAFGPVFISGIVTPWTREYFTKWLGFLVGTAVLSGVVGICVSIATTLFTSFAFNEVTGATSPQAAHLMVVSIVILTINSLIQQAPSIASAMIPGSIGASRGTAQGIKSAASTALNKAKSAGGTANDVINKAKDRLNRKKDGSGSENNPGTNQSAPPGGGRGGGSNAQEKLKYPTLKL